MGALNGKLSSAANEGLRLAQETLGAQRHPHQTGDLYTQPIEIFPANIPANGNLWILCRILYCNYKPLTQDGQGSLEPFRFCRVVWIEHAPDNRFPDR